MNHKRVESMGIKFFKKRDRRKKSYGDTTRRRHISDILENLSYQKNLNGMGESQLSPPEWMRQCSIEEAIEAIDRCRWDERNVFSSEALNPLHRRSHCVFFPTESRNVVQVLRFSKDLFYLGTVLFRFEDANSQDYYHKLIIS